MLKVQFKDGGQIVNKSDLMDSNCDQASLLPNDMSAKDKHNYIRAKSFRESTRSELNLVFLIPLKFLEIVNIVLIQVYQAVMYVFAKSHRLVKFLCLRSTALLSNHRISPH